MGKLSYLTASTHSAAATTLISSSVSKKTSPGKSISLHAPGGRGFSWKCLARSSRSKTWGKVLGMPRSDRKNVTIQHYETNSGQCSPSRSKVIFILGKNCFSGGLHPFQALYSGHISQTPPFSRVGQRIDFKSLHFLTRTVANNSESLKIRQFVW